jgi:anti-anti-sigma regulatory factor
MMHAASIEPAVGDRSPVVVELIGDLDATLAQTLRETLEAQKLRGESHVVVSFRHLAEITNEGVSAAARAIAESRLGGCAVSVYAQGRRVRAMLQLARLSCERGELETLGNGRHVMIARHAH